MFSFPYRTKLIDEGKIVDPRVTLEIKTPVGFATIAFLIDSGADVTTLPLKPAIKIFNFNPDPKQKIKIGGVEGMGVDAYPFKLRAKLADREFDLRCYLIPYIF